MTGEGRNRLAYSMLSIGSLEMPVLEILTRSMAKRLNGRGVELHIDVDRTDSLSYAETMIGHRQHDIYLVSDLMNEGIEPAKPLAREIKEKYPSSSVIGVSDVGFKRSPAESGYDETFNLSSHDIPGSLLGALERIGRVPVEV